ncbi:hypothetical protein ABZ636_03755 [Streptomyces sp. NPDC007251]|uniref:hypothetical protein n=1 Tax=Streptomyces sp. NPDC007251 TaxID=3154483 RepID=UPI0033E61ADC
MNQPLRAVLTVTIETHADGDYYTGQSDLVRHATRWIEEAMYDRDDVERVTVGDPTAELMRAQAEAHQYRTALEGIARRPAVLPPVDRAALRARIAEALYRHEWPGKQIWQQALAMDRETFEAMADAVLALLPEQADRAAEMDRLRTENGRMRHELEVMYGGAFDSLKPEPADRAADGHLCGNCEGVDPNSCLTRPKADSKAAVYAEVADRLATDAEQGDKDGLTRIYRRSAARQVRAWGEELRRLAGGQPTPDTEAPVSPCSEVPCNHDGTGEPCSRHEQEAAHADGDHELCGPECTASRCTCDSEDHTHDGGCPLYEPAPPAA